jgi:hypothetical protein
MLQGKEEVKEDMGREVKISLETAAPRSVLQSTQPLRMEKK